MVCTCIMDFMEKEIVSFLRGEIDWELFEREYKKCEQCKGEQEDGRTEVSG